MCTYNEKKNSQKQLSVAYDELPRICYTGTAFVKIWSQTVHNIQHLYNNRVYE